MRERPPLPVEVVEGEERDQDGDDDDDRRDHRDQDSPSGVLPGHGLVQLVRVFTLDALVIRGTAAIGQSVADVAGAPVLAVVLADRQLAASGPRPGAGAPADGVLVRGRYLADAPVHAQPRAHVGVADVNLQPRNAL